MTCKQAILYAAAQNPVGEELYAAGAYLGQSHHLASVRAQDIMRWSWRVHPGRGNSQALD
jgi:hypothetical protein